MVTGLAFCVQQINKGSFYGNVTTGRVADSSREEAKRSGAICYVGSACSVCGSCIRYTSSQSCRNCQMTRRKKLAEQGNPQEKTAHLLKMIGANREEALRMKYGRYYGNPCKNCGGKIRQTSSTGCVACERERKAKR